MTKVELSQYIAQALYNLQKLPAKDDHRVTRIAQAYKENLNYRFGLALTVLGLYREEWTEEERRAVRLYCISSHVSNVPQPIPDGNWKFTKDRRTGKLVAGVIF